METCDRDQRPDAGIEGGEEKTVSNKRGIIQAKKNPGQNANHQNALVVNNTNTRRFSFRTPGSVATLRPEKTYILEKNTQLQTTTFDIRNNTSPKAANLWKLIEHKRL